MSNQSYFLKSGFPRAALGNGIGRYIQQLQRITLKFCKHHGSSRGVRDFIEKDLVEYAKANPGVAVYLKARRHRGPVVKAEYLNGQTFWMYLRQYTREDVIKYMELARTQQSDGTKLRLRKHWYTNFPSIQGPWTPFLFKDPKINITEFPNKEYGAAPKHHSSATEDVLKLFQLQQMHFKEIESSAANPDSTISDEISKKHFKS